MNEKSLVIIAILLLSQAVWGDCPKPKVSHPIPEQDWPFIRQFLFNSLSVPPFYGCEMKDKNGRTMFRIDFSQDLVYKRPKSTWYYGPDKKLIVDLPNEDPGFGYTYDIYKLKPDGRGLESISSVTLYDEVVISYRP